tara:strand:+ start:2223 stop:2525 length:303 start_codon:yes stop_codon:yes gene_type:complete
MASVYRNDSHLANTRVNSKFTELYEPGNEFFTADTTEHEIESKHNQRPDLLAFELYGNQRLWWLFMHFNPNIIKDPIMDFTAGKTIIVPVAQGGSTDMRM